MRKFAKELAFVRRYHKIPAELDKAALYFGGREAVERAIEEALAREVFERDIRTEAEYRAYETEVGRTLFDKGHALTQTVVKIIELNAKLRAELAKGSGGAGSDKSPGVGKAGGASGGGRGARSLSLYELGKLKEKVEARILRRRHGRPRPPRADELSWRNTPSPASSASRATSRGSRSGSSGPGSPPTRTRPKPPRSSPTRSS